MEWKINSMSLKSNKQNKWQKLGCSFVLPMGRGPSSRIIRLWGGVVRRWLMRPIRALNDLRQWGQDSPVAACCGGLLMARDLRAVRLFLAVVMRCASCTAAPFLIAPRHAGRSWARVSHELWSMPKSFREAFRVSLKRFFWPPWERAPSSSSP